MAHWHGREIVGTPKTLLRMKRSAAGRGFPLTPMVGWLVANSGVIAYPTKVAAALEFPQAKCVSVD